MPFILQQGYFLSCSMWGECRISILPACVADGKRLRSRPYLSSRRKACPQKSGAGFAGVWGGLCSASVRAGQTSTGRLAPQQAKRVRPAHGAWLRKSQRDILSHCLPILSESSDTMSEFTIFQGGAMSLPEDAGAFPCRQPDVSIVGFVWISVGYPIFFPGCPWHNLNRMSG